MTPLSPEEVNERVARKLGVEICTSDNCPGPYAGIYSCESAIRDYSRRIEAAWKIVEHVNADKFEMIRTSGLLSVSCAFKFQPGYPEDKSVLIYSAAADTAPMAICLAYLKLE